MAASVTRQEGDFAALESAAHVGVGRRAERRLHAHFFGLGQTGHGIEPAAADNSDFRLWQSPSGTLARSQVKLVIIQEEKSLAATLGGSVLYPDSAGETPPRQPAGRRRYNSKYEDLGCGMRGGGAVRFRGSTR